jgi:uncharacterized protein (TIGR03435 family)
MPLGVSVFYKAAVYLLVALPAVAQSQRFATVSIKPAHSADPRDERFEVRPNGEWTANGVSVGRLMNRAYGLPANGSPRFSQLPNWALAEKYDIEAKAPSNIISAGLSDNEVRNRIQQMIRSLLADRFGLVMRVEDKSMAVYALAVASGGPKLQKSPLADKDCAFNTGAELCHSFAGGLGHPLNAKAIDMDDLALYIENWTDLPVVNHTALNGLFTVDTEGWVPMRLPPPPPGGTPSANPFAGLPTIFTVLGKLGLELKRKDEVLPVYTVERIERAKTN